MDSQRERCPNCFNFVEYCTCPDRTLRLVSDNDVFPCLCCDTPMATDFIPMVGWICAMCMDHFQGHPMEIKAIHARLKMHVI